MSKTCEFFMSFMKKNIYIWILLLCSFLCHGCAEQNNENDTGIQEAVSSWEEVLTESDEPNGDSILDSADMLSLIPEFSEDAYTVINNNMPYFTAEEKECKSAFEIYSDLDELGRCGAAYANICIEIMPTEERGAIGQIKPSGWQSVKYDIVDGKYLYNRCHLIGYQLAGENANEKNLITGTRYLNIFGMLPFENKVYDYVKETQNHVLYRVTPFYKDNNLVAAGVEIEAYSVEDAGAGICFNVFIYNSQPGIKIDYATGKSCLIEKDIFSDEEVREDFVEETADTQEYILNLNTRKFHLPACSSVDDIKEKNKEKVICSRNAIVEKGYEPCQRCRP